jgi:hypothetical protein
MPLFGDRLLASGQLIKMVFHCGQQIPVFDFPESGAAPIFGEKT